MTTTDTAPLSARLRHLDDETMCFDAAATYGLIREAADALDALSARVKDLLEHQDAVERCSYDAGWSAGRREMEARATQAEAERDAAQAALSTFRAQMRTALDKLLADNEVITHRPGGGQTPSDDLYICQVCGSSWDIGSHDVPEHHEDGCPIREMSEALSPAQQAPAVGAAQGGE